MLTRFTHPNSVVIYRSPLLASAGVPHGFSTRIGGLSAGPFDSLNLGNPNGCPVQDDEARIAGNYQRLESACEWEPVPEDGLDRWPGRAPANE